MYCKYNWWQVSHVNKLSLLTWRSFRVSTKLVTNSMIVSIQYCNICQLRPFRKGNANLQVIMGVLFASLFFPQKPATFFHTLILFFLRKNFPLQEENDVSSLNSLDMETEASPSSSSQLPQQQRQQQQQQVSRFTFGGESQEGSGSVSDSFHF